VGPSSKVVDRRRRWKGMVSSKYGMYGTQCNGGKVRCERRQESSACHSSSRRRDILSSSRCVKCAMKNEDEDEGHQNNINIGTRY
jgi:hypothetical protein